MKNLLLFLLVLLIISCKPTGDNSNSASCTNAELSELKVSKGKVYRIHDFQSNYVNARNVDIWLPKNYNDTTEHAVIYMHDGQMLFDSTTTWNKQEWRADEVLQGLIDKKSVVPAIIVGIWNIDGERYNNYFPHKALDYYKGDKAFLNDKDFNADNYLKFIVEELKPCIEATYSVNSDKAYNCTAGASMGGLISMYAICEYPTVFGGAACLSTHWPGISPKANEDIAGSIFSYLEDNIPSCDDHRLYFDYGDKTLDRFYLQYGPRVDSILANNNCNVGSGKNMYFKGHDHNERSWQRRLHIPFEFILPTH